jgi:hypothetical protein
MKMRKEGIKKNNSFKDIKNKKRKPKKAYFLRLIN